MSMRTAILVFLMAAGCVSKIGASGDRKLEGWGFEARIPTEISIKKEEGEPLDFELYHFLDQGHRVLLSMYVGNHPDCPQLDLGLACDEISEESGRLKDRRVTKENLVSREGLLFLGQENPALLHFWYSGLSQRESALADSIIDSIR